MICPTLGGAFLVLSTLLGAPAAGQQPAVRAWQEALNIPTYPLGEPDRVPVFYAGRKYQGAKGPVYPYPMLDRLSEARQDKSYKAVFLENKFLHFTILPELGGRIFTGTDKTNQYDFFYRQHVVKPALIGMAGAWISGGVEWNIPHHHRVTTFMPVDYRIVDNADGSKTVWLGETELRHRMKWLVGLTVHPDRSYLEITTKLFNRTPVAHSMLCFANVAVHANADYQVIFPPNTEFGTQHAKREFVHWPIGREVYHKLDRSGVDLSWWKNQPAPVSIFAWNYEDDFVGGYDHGKQAGVVHVADHHVAPGKKFFTWGCGEEGQMWDRVLTDGDGPYIELMAGAYSDNQPDYSWVQPYETRVVTEYWYPIRALGGIKNANREAAVNLEVDAKGTASLAVNTTTDVREARVVLKAGNKTLLDRETSIGPAEPWTAQFVLEANVKADDLELSVFAGARRLIAYQPPKPRREALPEPVTPPPAPKDVKTNEELYLIGLRLEQFHNPALEPYPYYEEAVKRDPSDVRANTALAILYCKRGMFTEAEQKLRAAIARSTHHYTSPKDTEALYYLGVSLRGQGKHDMAAEFFHRATWGHAFSAASYYALAEIACRKGDLAGALDFLERSLVTNTMNVKAWGLKAHVLRTWGRCEEALAAARETQRLDPLDFWANHEALAKATSVEAHLEVAADYAACGAWDEAIDVLARFVDAKSDKSRVYPMVYYDLAHLCEQNGDAAGAGRYRQLAARMPSDYCFPFRLESIDVLRRAAEANPRDAKALYYLGNLLCDIQPRQAIAVWEQSRKLDDRFALVHRNLGLAYARAEGNYAKGVASLTAAIARDPNEPRFFTELDQVSELAHVPHAQRLAVLEKHAATVAKRADSLLRLVNVCLYVNRCQQALDLLAKHHFRRWEGENGPHAMYVEAHLLLGQQQLKAKRYADAAKHFQAALEFPENFETGRPHHGGEKAAQIHYLLGVALEGAGQAAEAQRHFKLAVAATRDVAAVRLYHGLAQRKLGDEAGAKATFAELIQLGTEALRRGPRVDFFGIFGTPQSPAVQAAEAHYLVGLGQLGAGRRADAVRELEQAAKLNPNQLGVLTTLARLKEGD